MESLRRSLPPDHVTVGEGLASVDWNWSLDRRPELLERVLRLERLDRLDRRRSPIGNVAIIRSPFVDGAWMRALEQATTLLLPHRPDLAPVVAQATRHTSMTTASVLRNLLREYGHSDLATASDRALYGAMFAAKDFASPFKQMDEAIDHLLGILSNLAPSSALGLAQERRLTELASFVETLNLNDTSAWLLGDRGKTLRDPWIRLIATLGGFDTGVLSAQTAVLLREAESEGEDVHKAFFRLFDVGKRAELARWDRVHNPSDERQFLLQVLRWPRGSAVVAAMALGAHPERDDTASALRNILLDLPRKSVEAAVWAYLKLVPDEETAAAQLAQWQSDAVREAVASHGPLASEGRPTQLGRQLATDSVRQVQLAAIDRFGETVSACATPAVVALLQELADSENGPFTCHHCGTINDASRDSCISCHIVTRKPSAQAAEVLAKVAC
jgi:hypothetical protein